jgi:hypothetical protein
MKTSISQQISAIRNARLSLELDLESEDSQDTKEFIKMNIRALADAESFLTTIQNKASQDIEVRKQRGYRPCGKRAGGEFR